MTEPVIKDETERLRILLRQAEADKAELLAGLKQLHDYAMENCTRTRGLINASTIIAKHEANP